VLNSSSVIIESVWKCEFCSYSNQLKGKVVVYPSSSDAFYLLEDPKLKEVK